MKPLLLLVLLFLSSCHQVFIETPQPSDAKSLTKIPKALRGDWIIDSWFSEPGGKQSYYTIQKKRTTFYKEMKIGVKELNSTSFQIRNEKIYDMSKDSLTGHSFTQKEDSICFFILKSEELDFHADNQLKSTGKYFITNNKNENNWWEMNLIEYDQDKFSIRGMSIESADLASQLGILVKEEITEREKGGKIFDSPKKYLQGDFSSSDLNRFVELGGFPDTLAIFTRVNNLKKRLNYNE